MQQPEHGDAYSNGLHRLRLGGLPLTHPLLLKSTMVKNAHFESVIELYNDRTSGSGQHYVDTVAAMLGIGLHDGPDIGLLRSLALLPTFDIFSVRLLLRDIGIPSSADENLPPGIGRAVDAQMRKFTIPLLRYVYGADAQDNADLRHLIVLFRDPDVRRAEAHLRRLAEKLNIPVLQVPRFLEDYSDTFLAISLYQCTFIAIRPSVEQFLESIVHLKAHVQRSPVVLQALDRVHADFTRIMKSTAKRLGAAEQLVDLLWGENFNASLDTLQPKIHEFQFLLGYLLCGLAVKITAWTSAFPAATAGTPKKCIELITTDIVYALGQLRAAAENGLERRKTVTAAAGSSSLQAFLRSFSIH